MERINDLLLTGGLLWIAWQDFKYRKVYLSSYLMIYALYGIRFMFFKHPPMDVVWINLLVTGILVVTLLLYYLLRYGLKTGNKVKSSIGMGDLLLIPVLTASFSPGNFVLFLIVSYIIALSYGIIIRLIRKRDITIPLAGIQSLLLAIVLILESAGLWNSWNDLILN